MKNGKEKKTEKRSKNIQEESGGKAGGPRPEGLQSQGRLPDRQAKISTVVRNRSCRPKAIVPRGKMSQRENQAENALSGPAAPAAGSSGPGQIGYAAKHAKTPGHYIGPVRDRAL